MEQDVPALEAIKPGGKEHPIDWTINDGETVTLGGMTLDRASDAGPHARLHRPGPCRSQDGGRTYNVVFACSLRAPGTISPAVAAEFNATFPKFRALPCDVPLGDHPAQYNMIAKHAKLAGGGANPFVDPANCTVEADIQEAMFKATLAEQQGAAK